MKNIVKKTLKGKEYGFRLSTRSKALYQKETGKMLTSFFQDIQTAEGEYLLSVFLKECMNAYNAYEGNNERVTTDFVFELIDDTTQETWLEVLTELFEVPEVTSESEGEA